MSHIKSYFGIEREFDRFYDLLTGQKDSNSNDNGNISLSNDLNKISEEVWTNNDRNALPFEKAHYNRASIEQDP